MMKYSLSELGRDVGGKKHGAVAYLREIQPSAAAERDYYRQLKLMLDTLAKEVRESIIPAYRSELERGSLTDGMTYDVDSSWFINLGRMVASLVGISTNTVNRILDLEAQRHTSKFMDTAKKAIGVDISSVIRNSDLDGVIRVTTAMNTALIRNLAEDTIKRIEMTVYNNAIAGNSVKTLQGQLQKEFGISARRAKLIARDQMGKFNSTMTRLRQQQAGVTEYIWRTSHDERVRALHRSLEGKHYKWDEPTGAEGGLPPGQPVQCRCWSEGIIEF